MTTIAGNTNQDIQIGISSAEIDKVEKSEMGLDLTVTIITGFVGGQWRPDNDKNPAYNKGGIVGYFHQYQRIHAENQRGRESRLVSAGQTETEQYGRTCAHTRLYKSGAYKCRN